MTIVYGAMIFLAGVAAGYLIGIYETATRIHAGLQDQDYDTDL